MSIFLFSCNGTTNVPALEKGKHKKSGHMHKSKKHGKYADYGHARKMPPGQKKKMNGDQSAKRYAPGQNKKKGNPSGKKQNHHKKGHHHK